MTTAHFDFFDQSGSHLDRVDVLLLDTQGARAWAYAVMLNSPDRKVATRKGSQWRSLKQDATWLNDIHATLLELDNLGYRYPCPFPKTVEELTLENFNDLHRYFTESAVNLWAEKTKPWQEIVKVDQPFQKLNTLIHNLETSIPNLRREEFWKNNKEIMVIADGTELGYDIKPFRDCHSFDHIDVIIDGYILGKTLIESYLCNDDPNAWDTSGNIRTNGGCIFLLSDYRAQLYHSQEFQNWLTEHNCDYQNTQADFPIGNFAKGHKSRAEQLLGLPLWQTSCKVSVTI